MANTTQLIRDYLSTLSPPENVRHWKLYRGYHKLTFPVGEQSLRVWIGDLNEGISEEIYNNVIQHDDDYEPIDGLYVYDNGTDFYWFMSLRIGYHPDEMTIRGTNGVKECGVDGDLLAIVSENLVSNHFQDSNIYNRTEQNEEFSEEVFPEHGIWYTFKSNVTFTMIDYSLMVQGISSDAYFRLFDNEQEYCSIHDYGLHKPAGPTDEQYIQSILGH